MRRNLLIWGIPAVLYAVFFAWYTNLGGPLSEAEIEKYMSYIEAGDASPDRVAQMRRFLEEDEGKDFIMINVLHLKDTPDQIDGVAPGDTSADVMAKYVAYMVPALLQRACHPVLFGDAASNALDLHQIKGAEKWTSGAAMRYRSRRDMLDIALNPAFAKKHPFKIAALEKTIAYPVEDSLPFTDPRFLLFFVLLSFSGVVNAVFRRS